MLLLLSAFYVGFDIIIAILGDNPVQSFNFLRIYESQLCSSKMTIVIVHCRHFFEKINVFNLFAEFPKPRHKSGFDTIGTSLNIIAITYGHLSYFMVVFLMYSNMDPIFQFQNYVMPLIFPGYEVPGNMVGLLVLLMRCLFIIPMIRIVDIWSLIFCVSTIAAYLLLSCVSFLDYNAPIISLERRFVTKILSGNDILNIVLQINSIPISIACALILFSGLVMSVAFNFATIKMSQVIPMPIYLAFPIFAFATLIIIQIMMPMLIKICVGGEEVAWKWKYYIFYSKDVKYVTRMIRARQGVRINVGLFGFRFFFVKKSTKATYYYTLLSYTISALMAIEVDKMHKM